MKEKNRLAVILLNYNGKKYLDECFKTLFSCNDINKSDVYLLDNDSSDDSISYCQKYFPKVKIIETGENLGFSGAYNFAHEYLKKERLFYEYYFIVNNDVTFSDSSILQRSLKVLDENNKIGILSPTILNKQKTVELQGGNYIFISGTTLGYGSGLKYKPKDELLNSKWASGCALFIKSKLYDQVNGFDDYFMYQEDVGLSWKTINRGLKIVTDCNSSIIHFGGGTTKDNTLEHYYSERNRLLLYWQNLSTLSFVFVLPLFLIMRLILLLKQGKISIAKAKVKGLKDGFMIMAKYPRNNTSIKNDCKAIKLFISSQQQITN